MPEEEEEEEAEHLCTRIHYLAHLNLESAWCLVSGQHEKAVEPRILYGGLESVLSKCGS